jgi:DNA invertase Pin-like site-specific DNA recombinase
MTVAYSYRRWSDRKQNKGDSARRQKSPLKAVCEAHGWTLSPLSFVDAAARAFRGRHKETGKLGLFLRLIDDGTVKAGSVLIVEDLDRLTREEIDEAEDLFKRIIRSGVSIYVIRTERLYTKESLKNPFELFEAVWRMYLAHDESAKKAKRLKDWWQGARDRLAQKPLPRCPGWLEYDSGRFVSVADRVAAVRRIFRLAQDGLGILGICRQLNGEGLPFWGYSRKLGWNKSYVATLLHNRQVLGEYQPMTWEAGKRKLAGPVVRGYYPAIITEAEFQKVQRILRARKKQTGPTCNECRNLFTGLLHGKRGTLNFQRRVNNGREYCYLGTGTVSMRGLGTDAWLRYDVFEKTILKWLVEITPEDLIGDKKVTENIRRLEDAIADKERRIAQIQAKIDAGDNFASLLDRMTKEERQKRALMQELETRKASKAAPGALKGVQTVIGLVEKGGTPVRVKLKTMLKDLIERIDVEVKTDGARPVAYCAVGFTSGTMRRVFFETATGISGLWSPDGVFPAKDIDLSKTVGNQPADT